MRLASYKFVPKILIGKFVYQRTVILRCTVAKPAYVLIVEHTPQFAIMNMIIIFPDPLRDMFKLKIMKFPMMQVSQILTSKSHVARYHHSFLMITKIAVFRHQYLCTL